jgi:hypothetical protein
MGILAVRAAHASGALLLFCTVFRINLCLFCYGSCAAGLLLILLPFILYSEIAPVRPA